MNNSYTSRAEARIAEQLALIAAHKKGKTIQWRPRGRGDASWLSTATPCWDFTTTEYRVKPAEPLTGYITVYENDVVKALNFSELRTGGFYDSASSARFNAAARSARIFKIEEVL